MPVGCQKRISEIWAPRRSQFVISWVFLSQSPTLFECYSFAYCYYYHSCACFTQGYLVDCTSEIKPEQPSLREDFKWATVFVVLDIPFTLGLQSVKWLTYRRDSSWLEMKTLLQLPPPIKLIRETEASPSSQLTISHGQWDNTGIFIQAIPFWQLYSSFRNPPNSHLPHGAMNPL